MDVMLRRKRDQGDVKFKKIDLFLIINSWESHDIMGYYKVGRVLY